MGKKIEVIRKLVEPAFGKVVPCGSYYRILIENGIEAGKVWVDPIKDCRVSVKFKMNRFEFAEMLRKHIKSTLMLNPPELEGLQEYWQIDEYKSVDWTHKTKSVVRLRTLKWWY